MDRVKGPEFKQAESISLSFPKQIKLNNDVDLYYLDEVKDDSVKLEFSWTAGTKYAKDKLIASFTNKLLFSGTADRTAREISEEVDFYGGYLQKNIDKDHAGFTIYCLNENVSTIFKIVSEVLANCTFPVEELDKERTIALEQFKIDSEKVKNLCRRRFNAGLFGEESAYGRIVENADFEEISKSNVEAFYKDFYQNNRPTIFLCGKVDDSFIEDLREWSSQFSSGEKANTVSLDEQQTGEFHSEQEGAIQSAIRIGCRMFDKKHPDYFGFQLLNTVLGGYFGSRLMANIREDKGYTYGIGSSLAVMEDAAYFFIATEVGSEVREAAINEIFKELQKLQDEAIPEDELNRVKNYMFGEFLRQSDGSLAMMECFKNMYFNQLQESYYSDFFKALHKFTAADLQQLAQKYFQKDKMIVMSVG